MFLCLKTKQNKESKIITGVLQVNTTKKKQRQNSTFISRAQAFLQSCVGVGASSLLKGKQSTWIHSRAPGRIRKTVWVSCLCRAHWKDLRWGSLFETDFLLSIMHYEIQFLICLNALHANQKQTEPDQTLKSNTKNAQQGRPMQYIPQACTSPAVLVLTCYRGMLFPVSTWSWWGCCATPRAFQQPQQKPTITAL